MCGRFEHTAKAEWRNVSDSISITMYVCISSNQLYNCLAEDEEGERKKSMGEDSDSRGGFLACDLFKQSVYLLELGLFYG